ncbi:MAG: Ig-like domain-containing protein [Lachnospiraceae bacterium]|nr:Ig-like domain-containing protein [Lachnospiraceae bacterium]
MRYCTRIVSYLLMVCLLTSAVYTDNMIVVSAAGSPKTGIKLKIANQTVSGKTISIKKGKKKKIKVITPTKKNYKITFRSNKNSVVSVSKTGKITAKRVGTAKVTVIAKLKKKKYKSWVKIRVVSSDKKNNNSSPTKEPTTIPTDVPAEEPTTIPTDVPTEKPTIIPTEDPASDPSEVLDMYEITIKVNEKVFPAKLYQTEAAEAFMQKLPLSITMNELNGNEKYYYFSENLPTESQKVSQIHAGDLKLYGSSCLVLFYDSFSTAYSYTSLGYVENPEGLAEALGTGSVNVDITGSK